MDFINITKFLGHSIGYLLIAGLAIAGYKYKGLKPVPKALALYLLLMLFCEVLCRVLARTLGNNLVVVHIYSFLELGFMLWFYKRHMLVQRQRFLTFAGFVALAYIVAECIWLFGLNAFELHQFQPYAKIVDNFMVILLTLAYLYEKVNGYTEQSWGYFRLNTTFLAYFTLTTVVFLPLNFLLNDKGVIKDYVWAIHALINTSLYVYLSLKIAFNGVMHFSLSAFRQKLLYISMKIAGR